MFYTICFSRKKINAQKILDSCDGDQFIKSLIKSELGQEILLFYDCNLKCDSQHICWKSIWAALKYRIRINQTLPTFKYINWNITRSDYNYYFFVLLFDSPLHAVLLRSRNVCVFQLFAFLRGGVTCPPQILMCFNGVLAPHPIIMHCFALFCTALFRLHCFVFFALLWQFFLRYRAGPGNS